MSIKHSRLLGACALTTLAAILAGAKTASAQSTTAQPDPGQSPLQSSVAAAPPSDNSTPVQASQANGGSPATGTQANAGASPGQGTSVSGAPVAGSNQATLGDIVVTAERTQTNVQKTPISIAVVSGQQLISRGVTNLQNIENVEPSVKITTGQFNNSTAAIRGVSSNGGAVTINFDGQYNSQFNGLLYDISRVEVLKGPQGTLYGLNATAGALNVITNAPTLRKYSGNGSIEIGNYSEVVAQAAVNIPVGDNFALRLSVDHSDHDGYRTHPGQPASDYARFDSGRIGLLWKPIPRLSVRLTAEYTDEDFGDTALQGVALTPSALTPPGQPPYAINSNGLNPRSWALDFPGYHYGFQEEVRGDIEYDLGWAKLTYLGSYLHTKSTLFQSAYGTAVQAVDYQQNATTSVDQQEIRLGGVAPTGTKWQVGFFYIDTVNPNFTNIYNPVTSFSTPRTVPFLHFDDPDNDHENKAVYGQLTQSITDQISITGGLRYTSVDQARPGYSQLALNVGPYIGSKGAVIGFTPTAFKGSLSYDRLTWHAGLDYQWTPVNLFYFSASTSFKDGGFTQINTFQPEEITGYEVGSKNRLFGGKVELNGALYLYDYTNQQLTAFLQSNGAPVATTLNAGASSLKGGEINLTWLATPADRITVAANYTDAKFGTFFAAQPTVPNPASINADLGGRRPPFAPELVLNTGLEHHWALGDGQVVATANFRYTTAYYLDIYNLPGSHQGAYHQTDLSLGYRAPSDRWEVAAFVRNLEDDDILTNANFLVQGAGVYDFSWAPPRTFGVRLGAHF